jgi:hypothetical protein
VLADCLCDYSLAMLRNTSITTSFSEGEQEAAYAEAVKRMKARTDVSMIPACPMRDEAKQFRDQLGSFVFGKKTTLVE